jgi:hypothetical protein
MSVCLPCDGHTSESVLALCDDEFRHLYQLTLHDMLKLPLATIASMPQFMIYEHARRWGQYKPAPPSKSDLIAKTVGVLMHENGRLRAEIRRLRGDPPEVSIDG